MDNPEAIIKPALSFSSTAAEKTRHILAQRICIIKDMRKTFRKCCEIIRCAHMNENMTLFMSALVNFEMRLVKAKMCQ